MEYIKWFNQISLEDISEVGGKTASLGEMYQSMAGLNIEVPFGFSVTTGGYSHYLECNNLKKFLKEIFVDSEYLDKRKLAIKAKQARVAIEQAELPLVLKSEILSSYRMLQEREGEEISVAVRSSATAEDLPSASFAGQQESFLNLKDEDEILRACQDCFASLYTDRAVSYRQDHGISQVSIALSICVQRMVRSDLSCSGVMFTIDTESGFRNAIVINASWGLGENIVKGIVNPDDYIVFKELLGNDYIPILRKRIGGKESKLIYQKGTGGPVQNILTSKEEQEKFCLCEDEIIQLSKWGVSIEKHYSEKMNKDMPMDIEWAKDGISGKLYILQARPETVHSKRDVDTIKLYELKGKGKILVTGDSVGHLIGSGRVKIIRKKEDLMNFNAGDVLVAQQTEPDWGAYFKLAAAIITDRGGRTCHAAIVGRELGIPTVVGTKNATEILKEHQEVTVSCSRGSRCYVYEGLIPYDCKEIKIDQQIKIKTKLMMNLADPTMAFKASFIPNDGVGLARMEYIIANEIKIHPMALVKYNEIKNIEILAKINLLTRGYAEKKEYFVDKLAQGIATITAAFYPKDVIVRLSDFKSNEYNSLIGGSLFEKDEANPMIGFRGAFRYYHESYEDAFEMECRAIEKVRNTMGLKNLKVMIPFCRTVGEAKLIISKLKKNGLRQGRDHFEVYGMCEVPSNVLLAEEFAEVLDGFSIGSNDLTQLVLGIDRDSEILAPLFNENDPAVLKAIDMAIKGCHKKGRPIGICGQGPSDDINFAKYLIEHNIDSISLNPDAILEVRQNLAELENGVHVIAS